MSYSEVSSVEALTTARPRVLLRIRNKIKISAYTRRRSNVLNSAGLCVSVGNIYIAKILEETIY
jgi:hypothetical protein